MGSLIVLLTCAISWIPINFDNTTDFQFCFFFFLSISIFPPEENQGRLLCAVCLACETCKQNSWDHSLNTTGHGTYCQSHSFPLLTIKNNVAVNTRVYLCVYFLFSWVYTCKSGIASNCLTVLETDTLLSQVATPFYIFISEVYWIIVFLLLNYKSSFYILYTIVLSDNMICRYFFFLREWQSLLFSSWFFCF